MVQSSRQGRGQFRARAGALSGTQTVHELYGRLQSSRRAHCRSRGGLRWRPPPPHRGPRQAQGSSRRRKSSPGQRRAGHAQPDSRPHLEVGRSGPGVRLRPPCVHGPASCLPPLRACELHTVRADCLAGAASVPRLGWGLRLGHAPPRVMTFRDPHPWPSSAVVNGRGHRQPRNRQLRFVGPAPSRHPGIRRATRGALSARARSRQAQRGRRGRAGRGVPQAWAPCIDAPVPHAMRHQNIARHIKIRAAAVPLPRRPRLSATSRSPG